MMDWSSLYPAFATEASNTDESILDAEDSTRKITPISRDVDVADIGCGFGGLLVGLAPKLPNNLLLGEILLH